MTDIDKKNMVYVSKFVTRYTSLDRKCQICSKPGNIVHNKQNKWKIQILCTSCRKILTKNSDGMYNIKLIDVRDYTKDNFKKVHRYIGTLTQEHIDLINKALNCTVARSNLYKYLGISEAEFNNIVNLYEQEVPDIKAKLNERLEHNRITIKRQLKQKKELDNNTRNNLTRIKIKLGLSNRSLVKLSNNRITSGQISNICCGKNIPNELTKCILAETLGVSVLDLFPTDILYANVHNLKQYNDLVCSIQLRLRAYHCKQQVLGKKDIVKDLSKKINVSSTTLYDILNFRPDTTLIYPKTFKHETLLNITNFLNNEL